MSKVHRLKSGEKLPKAIIELASREKLTTAQVVGIGGVSRLRLAYFNSRRKKYEEHDFEEFLEVTSLLGNITLKDGHPFLHIHGTFGRRDLSVLGGHIVEATVFPTLEVVVTPTTNRALRKLDEKSGLNLIYRT